MSYKQGYEKNNVERQRTSEINILAGAVTDTEEDDFILGHSLVECFFSPWIPVDRVMCYIISTASMMNSSLLAWLKKRLCVAELFLEPLPCC
jgi:hypothetical protein